MPSERCRKMSKSLVCASGGGLHWLLWLTLSLNGTEKSTKQNKEITI
jgi:hypothetical protein